MSIDWTRVAEPQLDRYDTEVALRRRAQLAGEPARATAGCLRTIFDGTVAVKALEGPYVSIEQVGSADADDERIDIAESYVRQWPAAYRQYQDLMHTFYPIVDVTGQLQAAGQGGSISHSFESHWGSMCGSVEEPLGLAQAFVHEMAHTKLRALGILVESAHDLIRNDPEDLYPSPILIGIDRPMTAVFHAEYSFIYVTQLDLMMLAADPDDHLRDRLLYVLEKNVSRMIPGLEVIRENIEVDANGRQFVDSFIAWAERVLVEGKATLGASATLLVS